MLVSLIACFQMFPDFVEALPAYSVKFISTKYCDLVDFTRSHVYGQTVVICYYY